MSIKLDIKSIIVQSGYKLKYINDALNKKNNTNFTIQNLSNKIRNETIQYKLLKEIMDIIGYDIQFIKME